MLLTSAIPTLYKTNAQEEYIYKDERSLGSHSTMVSTAIRTNRLLQVRYMTSIVQSALEHPLLLSAQDLSCSNVSWEGIEGLFSGRQGMRDEGNRLDWFTRSENETLSSPENNVNHFKSPEHVTSDDRSLFDLFNQETRLSMTALHSVESFYDQNKPPRAVVHTEFQNLYEGFLGHSVPSPSAHPLLPPVEKPTRSDIYFREALEGLLNEEVPMKHEVGTPDWATVSGDGVLASARKDTYPSESLEQVISEDTSLFDQEAPFPVVFTHPVECFDNQLELFVPQSESGNFHEGFREAPLPYFAPKTQLGTVYTQTSPHPTFTFDNSSRHPIFRPVLLPHHQFRPVDLNASPSPSLNAPHTAASTSTTRKRPKEESVDYGVLCESALRCLWANCVEKIAREGCLSDADYQSRVHDHLKYHQDGFTQDSSGKWLCKWEGCREKLGSKRALERHFLSGSHVPIKFFCHECGKSWSRRSHET
ncbi:hypothetical protein J132_05027 [Termitomyces sp. J132]|nr:hypothetical protein J132_05027 [Termitomyces sp. J132]